MMISTQNLNGLLRSISSALRIPVILILLIMMAVTIVLIAMLITEFFTEHRHLNVSMPGIMDQMEEGSTPLKECIEESGLLKRQKSALLELTKHSNLSDFTREALAVRLLEEEKGHYDTAVIISDLIVKLGPAFGLLGTLIPLGPGIIALGQGNTTILAQSLLTAFDTTIIGLACAAAATVVSTVRKRWYRNYYSVLETLMEAVLELEKKND
jgi:biopolymer transport protein ExbB/TolQ